MRRRLTAYGIVMLAAGAAACPDPAAPVGVEDGDPPAAGADQVLAFVDVAVVPMDVGGVLAHQTVIVRDGRVASMGFATSIDVPAGAVVVQGRGRYLMPALMDMHVHLSAADLPTYLAHGIATVRNMWGTPGIARMAAEVEAGTLLGPRIVSTSPGVDGTPPQWPLTQLVTDPANAEAVVRAQADAGWRYLKVYTQLTPAVFDAVMAAARATGMTPMGHVPLRVDVRHALSEGIRTIEHLTGYDRAVSRASRAGTFGWADADPARFASLVDASEAAGVWNCPTMAIYAVLAQQHSPAERDLIVRNRRDFVRQLAARGGNRLLAGSDAGIDVVAPGVSLHAELAELVAAGLTPYQALRAATVDAARFLERADLGRVGPGVVADLLLVEGNPLDRVGNAGRIGGMILRGAWRPKTG